MIWSFAGIIIISITIFILILSVFIKQYYYKSIEEVLTNQIKLSADFYERYFSDASLYDNILNNVDVFWQQTPAQVQIVDISGKVLMDSISMKQEQPLNTADFTQAVSGGLGTWIGYTDYDDQAVMAVAYPLKADGQIVGVLRFITSLGIVDAQINSMIIVFILIGLIAVATAGIISLVLSNDIINPISEVTKAAQRMAQGDFNTRSRKRSNDEIGQLSDTLNYMAGEIIKKEKLKDEFIASVSHELRTPLTAIKGWAIILDTDDMDDRKLLKEGLGIISNEADRLSSIVEDLLDFSKLASGKMRLNRRKTDVKSVAEYVKTHMAPVAERNAIQFTTQCRDDIPVAYMDADRMKQVLINVLDNAFKFTDTGGEVELMAWAENGHLIFDVKDNGSGIDEEDLAHIKQKFYKGKNSKASSGLGLSIADEIVRLHGGSMDIDSSLNEGTTVTIRIPLEQGVGGPYIEN
ncbi:sensor histidine kinase [Mahella australiensis]|uniref:sensor histidine kinase n=1 Tax=Mahella australiensis TaxID=252966 RepID=UPI0002DD0E01|nr:HAMP domain-containing sensor histidine kinase [Mahella australiensis]